MNAEEKNRYFQELTLNLQHEGFAVKPETEEGLLPIELDGQRLCLALDTGSVRYWREDTADDHRSAALDKAISITKTTAEYMRQMETAPQLTASGLTGDYRCIYRAELATCTGKTCHLAGEFPPPRRRGLPVQKRDHIL